MPQDTYEQIKTILIERFAIDNKLISPEASFETTLNLDSMDAIDLLLAVNETFSIRVPEEALENIHTVADFVALVDKSRPNKK